MFDFGLYTQVSNSGPHGPLVSFLSTKEICYDPSLEPSHLDSSYEESQHVFLLQYLENYPLIIPVTPSYLEHWVGH